MTGRPGQQRGRRHTGRHNDGAGGDARPVGELDLMVVQCNDRHASAKRRTGGGALLHEVTCNRRRVADAIIGNAQRTGQAGSQRRLEFGEPALVHQFSAHAVRGVGRNPVAGIGKFVGVDADPERATTIIFGVGGKRRGQLVPATAGIAQSASCAGESSIATMCPIAAPLLPAPANSPSINVTFSPASTSPNAVAVPTSPAPITTTSADRDAFIPARNGTGRRGRTAA